MSQTTASKTEAASRSALGRLKLHAGRLAAMVIVCYYTVGLFLVTR